MTPHSSPQTDRNQSAAKLACVCTTIRRADRALSRAYDEALRPSGLTTTQYALLSRLARAGAPLPHGRLAEDLGMAGPTLTRNLTPLVREGLVQVERGKDRRTRFVSITPPGEAAFTRARPLWQAVQERIVTETGHDRISQLFEELDHLMAIIR